MRFLSAARRPVGVAVLSLAAIPFPAANGSSSAGAGSCVLPPALRLDHVSIAVAELQGAGERFEALGFVLKPGREHANGVANVHAKFPDGSELELITSPVVVDELSGQYRAFLAAGDGPAFLALFAGPLGPLSRRLQAAGVAHRTGAGTVSFAPDHAWGHIFFGSLNHSPTDRPEHFAHPNTAVALEAVWIAAANHAVELDLVGRLGATPCGEVDLPGAGAKGRLVPLRSGALVLLPSDLQRVAGRRLVGATVRVTDLGAARGFLARRGLVYDVVEHVRGRSVVVPPDTALGTWLELLEPAAATLGR